VAIGASAGGLEAYEAFLQACPADTGMGFVLISHLDPNKPSLLTEILQRSTPMPVTEAVDRTPVKTNHVYVIPPNREMIIHKGVLQLLLPRLAHGLRLPIDDFLSSLANDQGERAIGIILSGTATDGTEGLGAINRAGGVCIVQEPVTATYEGMPKSAIAAGYATHVLPVKEMPQAMLELAQQSLLRQNVPHIPAADQTKELGQILSQLHIVTGHDFSLYKKSTVGRRIERRMAEHNIDNLNTYLRFLKKKPLEAPALFKELLINVTTFFRDEEAFIVLKKEILPALLESKADDYIFRVWVAGCATGEEAYSIAIVLREMMDEAHKDFKVQIFATDLDSDVINIARSGIYSEVIAQIVSAERLQRFFYQADSGYRVKKDIRDMIVFAVQSVIKDPPFTRLDLLSCRNVLIYLESAQQEQLLVHFHYALNPDGVLFLSSSESVGNQTRLFSALNRKWKFYRALNNVAKSSIRLPRNINVTTHNKTPSNTMPTAKADSINIAELSNRLLLQSYAPTSVTTDIKGNILYVYGDISNYLRAPSGPVTTNVIEMTQDGLKMYISAALLAAAQGQPTLNQEVVLQTKDGLHTMHFSLRLLPTSNLLLLSFHEVKTIVQPAGKNKTGKRATAELARTQQLERELTYAKETMQASLEEQQASNEELKSTNEELQSTNEELQSSNEELETSREELQSLNEESITVNSELNGKIEQLYVIQNDLKNLLDNVNIGTLFLDHDLNIRRYTPEASKIYKLIATDVGRPLTDITSKLEYDTLVADLRCVLETLVPVQREVKTVDGTWYLARIQPYRTVNNVIEGVVLTFTDISETHEAIQMLAVEKVARDLAEGIINTVRVPLLVLDKNLVVESVNQSFSTRFKLDTDQTVGHKIYELGNNQWDIPSLRTLLEHILPEQQEIQGYEMELDSLPSGQQRLMLNAKRIITEIGSTELILLAMVEDHERV